MGLLKTQVCKGLPSVLITLEKDDAAITHSDDGRRPGAQLHRP
jgi:hypothetical protein